MAGTRKRAPDAPGPTSQPVRRRGAPAGQRPRRVASLRGGSRRLLSLGQRVLVVGLTLGILIAFLAGLAEQRWKEQGLRAEVAAGAAQLQTAEARNRELRGQLAAASPAAYRAYVEDTARRQLNLGYPDETVGLVNWSDPPAGAAPTPPPQPPAARPAGPAEPNWKQWLRLFFGQ